MRSTFSTIHHFKISPQAQHYSLLCGIIFGNVELKAHTISKFKSFRAVCCRCLNNNFQFLNNIIHIFTLFHPHVFSKYTNNVTRNFLPNGAFRYIAIFLQKEIIRMHLYSKYNQRNNFNVLHHRPTTENRRLHQQVPFSHIPISRP